jgi:hypothetical protein
MMGRDKASTHFDECKRRDKGINTAINQQSAKAIFEMNISMDFGDVAIWPDAASAVILKRWSLKHRECRGLDEIVTCIAKSWLGGDLLSRTLSQLQYTHFKMKFDITNGRATATRNPRVTGGYFSGRIQSRISFLKNESNENVLHAYLNPAMLRLGPTCDILLNVSHITCIFH